MQTDSQFTINGRKIGRDHPVYFIADIAANHDGDLDRANELIHLAAESGADAAKFQHFMARTIVSDHGFQSLRTSQSHQSKWSKSVYEVYQDASLSLEWTPVLKRTCDEAGIAFFTSPYARDIVDAVDPHVPAYKIGSGDITWLEILEHIAAKGKPCLLATGASSLEDVERAVQVIAAYNPQLALLQCNTNYTGQAVNFAHINLNVLKTYARLFPNVVLGLSDHTPGHASVLGAVALGAEIIEKHFTDDPRRTGPDHGFSMTPKTWREMVERTRELEMSLGNGVRQVEANERETVVLQRRAIRAAKDLPAGTLLTCDHLTMLRPCPPDGLSPYEASRLLGGRLKRSIPVGDCVRWQDLG